MIATIFMDTIILFGLGSFGWWIFSLFRIPTPRILGPLFFIGALRISGVDLPPTPGFVYLTVQIALGHFAGTKISKSVLKELRVMTTPVVIIITWAISLFFALGWVIYLITPLDLYTSFLSCSVGGLPEMSVIALDAGADAVVIVIMQTFRLVTTIVVFPLIIKAWLKKMHHESHHKHETQITADQPPEKTSIRALDTITENWTFFRAHKREIILSLLAASIGGLLFSHLKVPAGAMLGALFFVSFLSLAGINVKPLPSELFEFILIGVGIMIADRFTSETLNILFSIELLLPVVLVTTTSIVTSLLVSQVLYRITGWDYPTCFLAAAPGGFTVMTLLAASYGQDPVKVSLLHLCRLLTLKTVIPLVFMIWLSP